MTTATADEPITPGDLVGFRTPEFEQGISVAGYHLHFLNETRNRGGHALDFELASGRIEISTSSELHLSLPRTQAFLTAKLSGEDLAEQIHRTEGG
jgi:acetolactate decarboxylase